MEKENCFKNLAMTILMDGINSRLKPILRNEIILKSSIDFYKSIFIFSYTMQEFINISKHLKISESDKEFFVKEIEIYLDDLIKNYQNIDGLNKSLFITKLEVLKSIIIIFFNNKKTENNQIDTKFLNKSLEKLKIYYDCSDEDSLVLNKSDNNDINNELKMEIDNLSISTNFKESIIDMFKLNVDSFNMYLKIISCLYFFDEQIADLIKNCLSNMECTNLDFFDFMELKFPKKKEEMNFLKKYNQNISRSRRTSYDSVYFDDKQNQKIENYFKANVKKATESIDNIAEYNSISRENYTVNIKSLNIYDVGKLKQINENFSINCEKKLMNNSTNSLSDNIKNLKITRQTKLDEKVFSFKKNEINSCSSSINYGNYQKYSNSFNFNSNLSVSENPIINVLENDKLLRKDSSIKFTDSFNTNSMLSLNHNNNTINSLTSYTNLLMNPVNNGNNSNMMNTNSSNNLCMNSKFSNFSFENHLSLNKHNSLGSNLGIKNYTNYLNCKRSSDSINNSQKDKQCLKVNLDSVYNSRNTFNSMLANNSKKNFIKNSKLKTKKHKSVEIQKFLLKNVTTPQNIQGQGGNSTDKSTEYGSFESKQLVKFSSNIFYNKDSCGKRKNTIDSINQESDINREISNSKEKLERDRKNIVVSQFNLNDDEEGSNDEVLVMQTPASKKNNQIKNKEAKDNIENTRKNLLTIFDQVNN